MTPTNSTQHSGDSEIVSVEPFPELKLDPWKVYTDAMVEHDPSHVFALFSGGNDSVVITHWAKRNMGKRLNAVVHIDTGTAVPGVRKFVENFCGLYELPLLVYEAGDAYWTQVRKHGFPGPYGHRFAYVNLKERQLDALVREHKTHHFDRIMLLSGVRRAESDQRMGRVVPFNRVDCTVWCSPLIDFTHGDMWDYRRQYALPESNVAALLRRSGECNCGAYASAQQERIMLKQFWPDWWATVEDLEREVEAAGIEWCRWGGWDADYTQRASKKTDEDRFGIAGSQGGPMCDDCGSRQLELAEAA